MRPITGRCAEPPCESSPRPSVGPTLADLAHAYPGVVAAQRTTLGEIIRSQRELNALSMRRFADMVGISNPYMSQIERGLREPSEKVLDAIARNLDLSAEALYEQAGMTDSGEEGEEPAVRAAIRKDPRLNARQRRALFEVYDAFVGAQAPRRRRRRARGGDDAAD
jgi:transcriptional regulator with XRE-family HTH domain